MSRARSSRRYRRDDDREDARDTDQYIEPYQRRREACIVQALTAEGPRQIAKLNTYAEGKDFARRQPKHCVVRDMRTWRIVFDNRKEGT